LTQQGLRATARTWFWFILVGTVLGALVAFGLSVLIPPGYTARVTVLVTPAPKDTGITTNDLQVAQALTPTFAELATTRPVLDRVILSTGVTTDAETLSQSVTTSVPAGTSLLTISVSNRDAANAAALANAIASELRAYTPPGGSTSAGGLQVQMTVVDPATPPTVHEGPGLLVRIALGGAIALFLTVSIAFLAENLWPENREMFQRSA
jgi:capsular polysaccharide biosynthesis protein